MLVIVDSNALNIKRIACKEKGGENMQSFLLPKWFVWMCTFDGASQTFFCDNACGNIILKHILQNALQKTKCKTGEVQGEPLNQ